VSNIHDIVGIFRDHRLYREKLDTLQREAGKQPLSLCWSVPTRWNSKAVMLDRMYELREYVKQVLDNPPPGRETEEFEEKLHRLTASFDSDMKLAVGVLSVLYCCQEVSEVMESDSGTCSQMLFVAESLESKLMVRVPFRNVLQRLLRFF